MDLQRNTSVSTGIFSEEEEWTEDDELTEDGDIHPQVGRDKQRFIGLKEKISYRLQRINNSIFSKEQFKIVKEMSIQYGLTILELLPKFHKERKYWLVNTYEKDLQRMEEEIDKKERAFGNQENNKINQSGGQGASQRRRVKREEDRNITEKDSKEKLQ